MTPDMMEQESNSNDKRLLADATMERKGVSPPPSVLYAIAYNKSPEMMAEDVFRKRIMYKLTKKETVPKHLWCNGELLAYKLSAGTENLPNEGEEKRYEDKRHIDFITFVTDLFPDSYQQAVACVTIYFQDENDFLNLDEKRFETYFVNHSYEVKTIIKLYRECFLMNMQFEEWQTEEELEALLEDLQQPYYDMFYQKIVVTVKDPVINPKKERNEGEEVESQKGDNSEVNNDEQDTSRAITGESKCYEDHIVETTFEGSNGNTQYSRYVDVDICNILTSLQQALTLSVHLDN